MGLLDDGLRDVRHALRQLGRRPAFTTVAVGTLALGIGANSAVFTLLDAHFLTPLPYDDPDGIVLIWETDRNSMDVTTVAPGNYFAWREQAASFADVAAFNVDFATLSGDEGPAERVNGSVVAPHFFEVLGVGAALGTLFDEASTEAADGRLVVLSHGLWTRRYGADPGVVGRSIRVDGTPHTVTGVLPPSFRQPERTLTWQATELWRPQRLEASRDDFDSRYLRTVARLAPGVDVAQARAEMDALGARLTAAHPEDNGGRSILVRTLDEYLMSDVRPTLWLLLAAGAAVFAIVCANVANLTLARGEERRREFAVRAALGSGRGRLVRQLLVEGVVLALAGGALGMLLVQAGSGALQAVQSRYFSGLVDVEVDGAVVAFTLLVGVAGGLLFGLPMARSAARADLREALVHGGVRGGRGRRSSRLRDLLVVGQVGLATALLVIGGLLTRSFTELVSVPPGFDVRDRVAFTVSAPPDRRGAEALGAWFRELRATVAAVPGVEAVALVSDLPFTTENRWTGLGFDDREVDPTAPPRSEYRIVTPDYFQVMGIPHRSGTMPPSAWEVDRPVPVVVNDAFAARTWPDADPLGATFRLDWSEPLSLVVTAVVGDVRDDGYHAPTEPLFYVPWGALPQRRMSVVIRTVGDPATVAAGVRAAVSALDRDVPVADLRSLDALMAETVARPRAASLIGAVFALLALVVAAAGIYGVLSYAVHSRVREIGIRAALGASGRDLTGMVVGHTARLLALGLVTGVGAALLAGRTLAGLLFGVRPWDPATLLVTTLILGSVGLLAAWLPTRRAVRTDPREALRAE